MKFLIDECVGPFVARWLTSQGYDAVSIYDICPGISDQDVLCQATQQQRILITSDKDFGEMVFRNQMSHCGIILLRLSDERPNNKIAILKGILEKYATELENNFAVITDNSVRITKLFH